MKTKVLLVVGAAAVAALVVFALWERQSPPAQNAVQTPTGNQPDLAGVKTVGVDAVAKDPMAYAGRVGIEGVVAKVLQDRGAFTIIDVAEFKACGETGCAEYMVPVQVPKDEFEGTLPQSEETILAIGNVQPTETGYRFVVHEVRRQGVTILRRSRAPLAGKITIPDCLPATLLANKDALGLTAEQLARLNTIQANLSETQTRLQEKITHCQAELVELLERKPVDQAKVDHEKEEVEELKGKLVEEQRKAEEAARAVLTPEQVSKIAK
jgi:hypothetical protein